MQAVRRHVAAARHTQAGGGAHHGFERHVRLVGVDALLKHVPRRQTGTVIAPAFVVQVAKTGTQHRTRGSPGQPRARHGLRQVPSLGGVCTDTDTAQRSRACVSGRSAANSDSRGPVDSPWKLSRSPTSGCAQRVESVCRHAIWSVSSLANTSKSVHWEVSGHDNRQQ